MFLDEVFNPRFIAHKLFDAEGNTFPKFSALFQNFPIFKLLEGGRVWAQILRNDSANLDPFEIFIYGNFPSRKSLKSVVKTLCTFCGKTNWWIFLVEVLWY